MDALGPYYIVMFYGSNLGRLSPEALLREQSDKRQHNPELDSGQDRTGLESQKISSLISKVVNETGTIVLLDLSRFC